jgi:hypothetical protein
MMTPPVCGHFSIPGTTAAANTVITRLIAPFMGRSGAAPFSFLVDPAQKPDGSAIATLGKPGWIGPSSAFTHVTDLFYTSLTTQHSLFILQPLNYTYFTAAVPKNTTAITLAADPGVYSTKFKYPLPGSAIVPNVADNAISTGDYCAYPLNDGTWQLDKVASGSGTTPVLTTGTPNNTGAGIAQYAPFFFFGIQTDTNPCTGMPHPLFHSNVNTQTEKFQAAAGGSMGLFASLHKGDPMIFYSSNGTNAGILEVLAGFYSTEF